ncbi:hypothetical protein AMTR_s00029p00235510 [Amborella trichopoda]|uniref:Pentacotripeptide-repeat region of PRORP domain-containing protein n=1 Tax=Amborella trichopoda TaxID=13333 RepID=W1PPN6_AMBTC|nr:hypothetical protein AMTR_s00029p00235510 [Amborella trichopoda]
MASLNALCNRILKSPSSVMEFHAHLIRKGLEKSLFLSQKLITMYSDTCNITSAQLVFDQRFEKNVLLYNSIIRGNAINGLFEASLRLYHEMLYLGLKPDKFTYPFLIKACTQLGELELGKRIHVEIVEAKLDRDGLILCYLVEMYAKFGFVAAAHQLFDRISYRNLSIWTAIVTCYIRAGDLSKSWSLFQDMRLEGARPGVVILASVISTCNSKEFLQQGLGFHGYAIISGMSSDSLVSNSILAMYINCESLELACLYFSGMCQQGINSWADIILSFSRKGLEERAIKILARLNPNSGVLVKLIFEDSNLGKLGLDSRVIHGFVTKSGLGSDCFVNNSLLTMYSRRGDMGNAWKMFKEMTLKDLVSWNSMVSGYVNNNLYEGALNVFNKMIIEGVEPNHVTLSAIIQACVEIGSFEKGKQIHGYILRREIKSDMILINSLLLIYCSVEEIGISRMGYGVHGKGREALSLFSQLELEGLRPNHITVSCVLLACSHSGLVRESWQCFSRMIRAYQIKPTSENCACMVDVLCRAGELEEAERLLRKIPNEASSGAWGSLLGSSVSHGVVEVAERAADKLKVLEPENYGHYVLMSNVYRAKERWGEAGEIRERMRRKGAKKRPGLSWIEVNGKFNVFSAGEVSNS